MAAAGSDTMVYHIYPDVGVTLTVTWQDEADKSASDGTPRPFSISGPSEVLALLDEFANEPRSDEELEHCGVLAPPTEVTLAGAQREAAGIPLEAAFFAFAYPLPSLTNRFEELVVEQGRCEPWLFFLLLGGYCYFDAQRRLIRTNALMLTPAAARLEMVGPFRPSVSALQRLREAHRLQPCTLQTLVAAGYRAFAWVNPGEVPGGGPTILADGSQLEGGGCFVYEMQVKTGGGSSPHDRLPDGLPDGLPDSLSDGLSDDFPDDLPDGHLGPTGEPDGLCLWVAGWRNLTLHAGPPKASHDAGVLVRESLQRRRAARSRERRR